MTIWGVAGPTGFIGRHLCRTLLDDGERVVALVRRDRVGPPELDARAEVRTVDYADSAGLARALAGVDVCLNLVAASRGGRPRGGGEPSEGTRPGGGTLIADVVRTLLTAGSAAGLRRLVLASSTAVFGHRWQPVGPSSRPAPDTPYGWARLAGEEQALTLGADLGVEIVVARLSETYGPGSGSHGPLFRAIGRGGFRVVGDGRHPHQVGHVDDAVRALISCGRVAEAAGAALLISGPPLELRTWIEAIAAAAETSVRFVGAARVPGRLILRAARLLPGNIGGVRRQTWDYLLRPRAYDVSPSLRLLGPYQCSDLDSGVRATLEWYRARDDRA